jgi:hypothetical protein
LDIVSRTGIVHNGRLRGFCAADDVLEEVHGGRGRCLDKNKMIAQVPGGV